ncbi:hypothetical protein HUA78_31775 [Myxococcus sp. CA033]|uniref:hypothetical protein n=1 Tax=Myxococcus sp. CA033 TaxID=2741516 RepID=UPI001C2CD4F4|nr:hypothetical protein [Myxococcus sp. CA033]NTX39035.1 hypothetical protein [Myxococcus sp. CA033]
MTAMLVARGAGTIMAVPVGAAARRGYAMTAGRLWHMALAPPWLLLPVESQRAEVTP